MTKAGKIIIGAEVTGESIREEAGLKFLKKKRTRKDETVQELR